MRSTQRCESMNRTLKKVLDQKLLLYRFIQFFDASLEEMRFDDGEDDYITKHSEPVFKGALYHVMSHAATIYTRKSFQILCNEMEKESMYIVREEKPMSICAEDAIFY